MTPPNQRRQYYLAPNFDYPADGIIALGKIFSDPFDLGTCLNPDGPPEFPKNMKVQGTVRVDWKGLKVCSNSGLFGVFANFLSVVGIDLETRVNWEKKKKDIFNFKTLETSFIEPTLAYYKQSLEDLNVAQHIIDSDFKAPVYMITGVKIARKADLESVDLNNLSAKSDAIAAAATENARQSTESSVDRDAQVPVTNLPMGNTVTDEPTTEPPMDSDTQVPEADSATETTVTDALANESATEPVTDPSIDSDAHLLAADGASVTTAVDKPAEADSTASQDRQVSMEDSSNIGIAAKVGASGTPAGVPVGGGVKLAFAAGRAHHESWGDSSDFVFAYRIRKIRYDKGEKLKHKQLEKGALFALGSDATPIKEKVEIVVDAVKVIGVASEGDTATMLKETVATAAFDDLDGEEVECRIPKPSEGVSDDDELDLQ
jgi:hypothetical protein